MPRPWAATPGMNSGDVAGPDSSRVEAKEESMPARSQPVLALFGAMLLLAACETAPVTGRSQMMLVSESEEQQLGLQAYRQVRASAPPSKNTVANEMVERVGWRIAKAAEKPPGELWKAPHYHWEFTTIDKNVEIGRASCR